MTREAIGMRVPPESIGRSQTLSAGLCRCVARLHGCQRSLLAGICSIALAGAVSFAAEPPRPILRSVYPAGGQAGTTVLVTIDGAALDGPPFDGLAFHRPGNDRPESGGPASGDPALAKASPVAIPPQSSQPVSNAPRLWFADPRITALPTAAKSFEVTIPADVEPQRVDVRVVGRGGVSGPRVFQITPAVERLEQEPNDTPSQATAAGATSTNATATGATATGTNATSANATGANAVAVMVNGRLEKPADIDCYRVFCRAGQTVVFDLWADRLDSPLRGALEIVDASGRRLAADRGRLGSIDPRIDFRVPADGEYTVRVFEQTFLGGADYVYRLAIDAGPRIDFVTPAILARGSQPVAATLWGRNLGEQPHEAAPRLVAAAGPLEWLRGEWELPGAGANQPSALSPLRPSREAFVDSVSTRWLSGLQPVTTPLIEPLDGERPTIEDGNGNHSATKARTVAVPSDLTGRLEAPDERDWYVFEARRGEVFHLEGFAERLGSPVDLELFVFDAEGRELLRLADQPSNPLGPRFPTDTTDPAGRFTAPRDGSYYLVASNAIGGAAVDPRRRYWISFRREDADFRLVVVPHRGEPGAGLRATRGGRESLDVLVHRRNGFLGPLRIDSLNLPTGWNCENSWIAAGESHGLVIVTAPASGAPEMVLPQWRGVATVAGRELARSAAAGATIRTGDPRGVARTTQGTPIAAVGESPLFVEAVLEPPLEIGRANSMATLDADPNDSVAFLPTLFQDSVVEVRVDVRREMGDAGPIELRAIGLPRGVRAGFATIPAGENRGWISLSVTGEQIEGPFSFAIQADLLAVDPVASANAGRRSPKPPVASELSNLVSAKVATGRIQMSIDPRTPRKIARGEVIHVRYSAERRHGFIGKIHTELAAPGGVRGIRGRGVTFTSQTETGEIQIIATENAPLGPIEGLRLEAIGTVEDQPTYLASCLLDLEITE